MFAFPSELRVRAHACKNRTFSVLRSPSLSIAHISQVTNIKYSLLPWWQPKVLMCWNSCLQPSLFLPCLYCASLYVVSNRRWKAYQKYVQWSSMDTVFILYATTYLPHKHLLTLSEENLPYFWQAWERPSALPLQHPTWGSP